VVVVVVVSAGGGGGGGRVILSESCHDLERPWYSSKAVSTPGINCLGLGERGIRGVVAVAVVVVRGDFSGKRMVLRSSLLG